MFRNYCELIVKSTVGDHDANVAATKELREQQVRGKGIFAMLAKGLEVNMVSTQFIADYFQVNYVQVQPRTASTPEPAETPHRLLLTTPSPTSALQHGIVIPTPHSPLGPPPTGPSPTGPTPATNPSPASPASPPPEDQLPTPTRKIAKAVRMSQKQNPSI